MAETGDSLSGRLALWSGGLTLDAVPQAVAADARLRILDIAGVTVAASVTEAGRIVRDAALRLGGRGGARVLGFGDAMPPANAAMANGTMAHVHDYDDTHAAARLHVSAPVVSTALALGEARGATARDILAAVIAGSEIAARLGAMAAGAFHDRGWHATGVLGAIGAAYAAARLHRLDVAMTQNAIGIAASQAAGIGEPFADGTWTKRLHAGWAAHCGIAAAELAACGFTGPAKGLDGARGLFAAHLGNGAQPFHHVTDGLGTDWQCARSSFKPYPCGHLIHGFVEAALALHADGLRAGAIARIVCPLAPWVMPMIAEPRAQKAAPDSEGAAKISLYYCVAAALAQGRFGLDAFTDDALRDPDILALAQKISCAADPDAPEDQSKGRLIAETRDGGRIEKVVVDGLGSERNPMTADQVHAKFRETMAFGGLGMRADDALAAAERIETAEDLRRLVTLCCR